MKTTSQPTDTILIKAHTSSEEDECHFAIIHYRKEWKEIMRKHLEAVQSFSFFFLSFFNASVGFYRADDEIDTLLQGKDWAFVELIDEEQEKFSLSESQLDTYCLSVHKEGMAHFLAYGKSTGEDFWTEDFDIRSLFKITDK